MAKIERNYRVNTPFHADVLLSSLFVQDVGRTTCTLSVQLCCHDTVVARQLLHHICWACSLITLLRRRCIVTNPWTHRPSENCRSWGRMAPEFTEKPIKKIPIFTWTDTAYQAQGCIHIQSCSKKSHSWNVLAFSGVDKETPQPVSTYPCLLQNHRNLP